MDLVRLSIAMVVNMKDSLKTESRMAREQRNIQMATYSKVNLSKEKDMAKENPIIQMEKYMRETT